LGFFCWGFGVGDGLVRSSKEFEEILDMLDPERKKRKVVDAHARVPQIVRELWNELSQSFFGSTCQSLTTFVFGMKQAAEGVSGVTAINPAIHLNFFTLQLPKKRLRRKIRVVIDEEEIYESWNQIGSPERCLLCGSQFHVGSYTLPTKTGSVYLCPNCAKNDKRWKKPDFASFPA
jgi:hypothetical protein